MFPKDRASAIRGERSVGHSTGGLSELSTDLTKYQILIFFWHSIRVYEHIEYMYWCTVSVACVFQLMCIYWIYWQKSWQLTTELSRIGGSSTEMIRLAEMLLSFLNVITSSRMHIFFMYACMYPWCGVPQVTDILRSTKLTERISIEIHWAPQFTVVSVVFSSRCFDSTPFCCWANSVGHASTGWGTWIDLNQLWKRWAKLLDGPRECGNGIIDAKMMGSHSIIPRASQIVNFDFFW